MKRFILPFCLVLAIIAGHDVSSQPINLFPGLIQPSGCRVGAVLSLDQFSSSGYSSVRAASPNGEYVAGAWVVANNYVFDTSVLLPPNCTDDIFDFQTDDDLGLNLMAVRISPTTSSASNADIREIKLVWDVNLNGQWDALLDQVLMTRPGEALDSSVGAVFYNGPQAPIAVLSDTGEGPTHFLEQCNVNAGDSDPNLFPGPRNGTNSRFNIFGGGTDGCYIGLLAVVVIGDSPKTGTQFGMSLEAYAADIPGSSGVSTHQISSGFSSSRNPQGANIRLQMVGGTPSSHTPLEHFSNSSGNAESDVEVLHFTGGQQGEGLLSRFRALKIYPGTREVIAMAVGICDGGSLASTTAPILPEIAGAVVQIAGGLATLPCVPSDSTDGFATAINGATLIFRGPLARYMGTVRLYADECSIGQIVLGNCLPTPFALFLPTLATLHGGGDGVLFQPGENSVLATTTYNEATGEAIARFGYRQDQALFTTNGNLIAAASDPCARTLGACDLGAPTPQFLVPVAGSRPLILIFTVDIDSNSPPGVVDVLLSFSTFDDSAINLGLLISGGAPPPCFDFRFTAQKRAIGAGGKVGTRGVCASNFIDLELEQNSFTVEALEHPSDAVSAAGLSAASMDTDNSCAIETPELFSAIDRWTDSAIDKAIFLGAVDAWTLGIDLCDTAAPEMRGELSSSLKFYGVKHQRSALGAMRFDFAGAGIEQAELSIYTLSGQLVHQSATEQASQSLIWNLRTSQGVPVANGTYLYQILMYDAHGNAIQSPIQKLVVVR